MKDAIIWLLESVNNSLINLSASTALTGELSEFSSTLYRYIVVIQASVALPIAYVVLSLFCVLALYDAAVKAEHVGSGTMGVEIIVHLLIKLSLCIWAIENCSLILNAIFDITADFTGNAADYLQTSSQSGLDMTALEAAVDDLSFWLQFTALLATVASFFIMHFAVIMANVIVIVRFIELYLYFCVAPVPIATLPSPELSQIGKNFLKSFAAVCIQGTLIYLVLSFFPFIASGMLSGSDSFLEIVVGMIGYAVVLIIAVFSTNRWAKSICGAM